jgi:hypothetical protein
MREDIVPEPRKDDVFLEVQLLHPVLEVGPERPFAEDHEARVGCPDSTCGTASIRWRCPLCGTSAATLPTTGALCGRKNAACTLTASEAGDAIDVDAFASW